MGDNSRSNSQDLLHILGVGSIFRACKSFISKCYPHKKTIFFKKMGNIIKKPKSKDQDNNKTAKYKNQTSMKINTNKDNNIKTQGNHDPRHIGLNSPKGSFRRRSIDNYITRSPQWSPAHLSHSTSRGPSLLSRNLSQGASSPFSRSASRGPAGPARTASLLRTMSQRNSVDASSAAALFQRSLSRSASRTGPILYSNSHGLMKPPAMERELECTLDELCFGCVKKIKITRDTITDSGQLAEEDETFTIKVKPGWRKGTKITFENKGNEIPGADPADVIFTIAEKNHLLFTRKDDDLELEVEIPLTEALTDCTLSVPLLGGQMMNLTINDVIHPGYEKIIAGQGMPKINEPTIRGNLIIVFSIKFPKKLTEEQRSEAANILQQTC